MKFTIFHKGFTPLWYIMSTFPSGKSIDIFSTVKVFFQLRRGIHVKYEY